MCTVTLVVRRHGYSLGMNRDEQLTRVAARPPRLSRVRGRTILAPSEPNGGTWIGVNDAGATLALINWYAVTARPTGLAGSRGAVVRAALAALTPDEVHQRLMDLRLGSVKPFRLVGIFPASRTVTEWRWNLEHLERRKHPWSTSTWISSGYNEPGAQRARGRVFRQALQQERVGGMAWLRGLHRSHGVRRGPYSHCMHRADAATVSYTEITVTSRSATMRYAPGAPCCTPAVRAGQLRVSSV